ncbi:MAG: NYN domain-containing protein [Cyclobacteriaceae bacterium]|nr:NYN domain-containing protein [Cyclobacteriaceae bacterium]
MELKLAVLIDADNVPSANIKEMIDEIKKFGIPTIKRIYGDWTSTRAARWKSLLLEHAIVPIQQYSYTTGKNSTDSAMIIDAMDILHSEKVEGFCIVSSDSDFTRLATRLRESGMKVIGLGEKKTPKPFIVACDKFIYIEILAADSKVKPDKKSPDKSQESVPKSLLKSIRLSVQDLEDDDGWAALGHMGNLLSKKEPDFDPRNYGFGKLSTFMRSLNQHFELKEEKEKNTTHIFVRNKQ